MLYIILWIVAGLALGEALIIVAFLILQKHPDIRSGNTTERPNQNDNPTEAASGLQRHRK